MAKQQDKKFTALAEAEAMSRAKDEFLAIVSHELRTPLTSIIGWVWLLRAGGLSPADQTRALDVIDRNMKLQAQIIEDLLDVSTIVTGKLKIIKRPVDIGVILRQAVDSASKEALEKSILVEVQVDAQTAVMGDASRLQQIFWNLVSNAIKFNHPSGHVWAQLAVAGGSAVVSVKDDGDGIDAEFLKEIFDLLHQEEASMTRRHRGLGIGLAISKHLTELHGGNISVQSPGTEKGSTFTVTLPLIASGPTPESLLAQLPATPLADLQHTLNGVRVLVVDDNIDTLMVICEVLSYCGAQIDKASSAGEALRALQASLPDLLISDIAMPVEDGYSLIAKVRALSAQRGGRLPAIALTAYANDKDKQLALKSGFDAYRTKPVEPADLVDAVRTLLRKK